MDDHPNYEDIAKAAVAENERLRAELVVEKEVRRWFAAKAREHGFEGGDP